MGWATKANNLFLPVPGEEGQCTHTKKYQKQHLYLLKLIKPVSFRDPILPSLQLLGSICCRLFGKIIRKKTSLF